MIKIIKNSMTEPINIQCENCKSELQYNFEDIQRREVPSLFCGTRSKRFIVCPVCKSEINIDDRSEYRDESESEAADE